ncbi:integral membrane protein, partial [Colletotrichum incanum]
LFRTLFRQLLGRRRRDVRSDNTPSQPGRGLAARKCPELCERQQLRSRESWVPMVNIVDLLGKADNLSDAEPALNKQPAVLGMVISFLIFAWICGVYRLYVRYFVIRCPGWDDYFVMLSLLTSLLLSAATCAGMLSALRSSTTDADPFDKATEYGLGKHFILLGIDGMRDFIKAFYVCNGAYPMATALIKLALLFQYLRMFERRTKSRFITIFFITFTAIWGLVYSFLAWVPCVPVWAFWDFFSLTEARWAFGSHDPVVFARSFESHVGINVALDLIVFAIPIPLFLKAGLLKKSRMSLLGLFAMGVLVNVLGIFRLVGITQSRAGTYPTLDPSWYGCTPIVLAAVEINLATICASLPVFWPTLQKNIGQIFITKEVEITSEIRRFSTLQDEEATAELRDFSPRKPSKALGNDSNARWYTETLSLTRSTKTEVESKRLVSKPSEKSLFSEGLKKISNDQESQDRHVSSQSRSHLRR